MKGEVESGYRTSATISIVGEESEPVAEIKEGLALTRNANGCVYLPASADDEFYGLAWNEPDHDGMVSVQHGGLRKFYGDGESTYALDDALVVGANGVLIPYDSGTHTPDQIVGRVEELPFEASEGEELDKLGWVRL